MTTENQHASSAGEELVLKRGKQPRNEDQIPHSSPSNEPTNAAGTADHSSTLLPSLVTLPDELILHIASFLDNPSWANLAFAWKRFLVNFAQSLDPNNLVRQRLQLACTRQAYFNALMCRRMYLRCPGNANELVLNHLKNGRNYNSQTRQEARALAEALSMTNMLWVVRAPPEFFLAYEEFATLDYYRRNQDYRVVTVNLRSKADLLEELLEHVEPLLRNRLSSKQPYFAFQLSSDECKYHDELDHESSWLVRADETHLYEDEFARHTSNCLRLLFGSPRAPSDNISSEEVPRQCIFYLQSLDISRPLAPEDFDAFVAAMQPQSRMKGSGTIHEFALCCHSDTRVESFARLVDALILLDSVSIMQMDFLDCDNENRSAFFSELMRFVEHSSTIDSLTCCIEGLSAADSARLAQALERNHSMTAFYVEDNTFCEGFGASMSRILSRNLAPRLDTIHVPEGASDEDTSLLIEALQQNTHVKYLYVSIGPRSFRALKAMLRVNTGIQELYVIEHRRIEEPTGEWKSVPCISGLFDALSENRALELFAPSYFRFGQAGTRALARMLCKNKTLNELALRSLIYDGTEVPQTVLKVFQKRQNRSLRHLSWKFQDGNAAQRRRQIVTRPQQDS